MIAAAHSYPLEDTLPQERTRIETTLYDLIETVGDELRPGEEGILAEAVLHVLDNGRTRFRGDARALEGLGE